MTTLKLLSELEGLLAAEPTIEKKAFIGFDGFIDKIIRPVKTRLEYSITYFETISDFIERIKQAQGKSGQIELKTQLVKAGGNAPIFANALGKLGVRSFCVGSCGFPHTHDVFKSIDPNCELYSVLNPGMSQALEFTEGKLILSDFDVFDHYNWSYLKCHFDLDKIRNAVASAGLCAFLDWANLPHSSDLWEGVLDDIIKPSGRHDYLFLFDLCDPSRKTVEQIDEVLDLISCFSAYGKVILGLNENETLKIWAAINGKNYDTLPVNSGEVSVAGQSIFSSMGIAYLLVHTVDRTILFHSQGKLELQGKLVTKPKVLTGGGDNLNAGFALGLLLGLSGEHCMLLGMAASGSYIENGTSPSMQELINYIHEWKNSLHESSEENEVVLHSA